MEKVVAILGIKKEEKERIKEQLQNQQEYKNRYKFVIPDVLVNETTSGDILLCVDWITYNRIMFAIEVTFPDMLPFTKLKLLGSKDIKEILPV